MADWEFLIQKEGVRAWLPLKPPIAQLESGRYRVVARSHRINTEVEVRLTYQSQVQRLQKWIRHTNEKGSMPVFPYIHLEPGLWEISCSGNLMSELVGDSWKHTVQLQVLPVKSESEVDQPQVELEDEHPTIDPLDSSKSEVDQPQVELEDEHPTIDPLDSSQVEVWPVNSESELDQPTPELVEASVPVPIGLSLDRRTYIAFPGESIALVGQVYLVEENDRTSESQIEQTVNTYQLLIRLRDPENSQTIKEIRQLLSFPMLPGLFEYSFDLPRECPTRLILGELQLFDAALPDVASSMVTQEFTIAVGVHDLIETIAAQPSDSGTTPFPEQLAPGKVKLKADSQKEKSQGKPSVNLSFFNLTKDPQEHHHTNFNPAPYTPIPDRLYEPDSEKLTPKSPQLPPIGNNSVSHDRPDIPDRPQVDSEKDANQDLQPRKPLSLPPIQKPDRPIEYSMESELVAEEQEGDRSFLSPLDREFLRLKFQDRFSERLKILAEDPEPLEILEPNPLTDSGEDSHESEDLESDELPTDEMFVYEEIVSDPEELVVPIQGAIELYEQPPVPKPELQVPEGELVAGESIIILVKLPDLLSRLYVKLWVLDPQTRTLLEPPRWLINFQPHLYYGGMETNTELTVPFGCVEIQIEAISVEVATERESHKVKVNRMVVPPEFKMEN
ncbi:MAG: hypothetical protein GDA56_12195 [Hormoscilla sp. GM7CHS1pb]|nr:hypothetical protein [Hormoscilla sp. GM7CHS1pb]